MPVVYGDNLSQALAAIGQSCRTTSTSVPHGGQRRARVHRWRPRREIYAIAREALYNAFQHAQAGNIELELVYGCEFSGLCARRRQRHGAAAARPGRHARTRERLGGTLELLSLPEQGTEVILKVPGAMCYQTPRSGWLYRLAAWLGRTGSQG
jgi:nitrate/nitrite-specific signal transduction histidine kinase